MQVFLQLARGNSVTPTSLLPVLIPRAGDDLFQSRNKRINTLAALDEDGQHAPAE